MAIIAVTATSAQRAKRVLAQQLPHRPGVYLFRGPSDEVLYIGTAGNVALITAKGTTLTFVGLQAGQTLSVRASRVLSTGTTAGSIIALV